MLCAAKSLLSSAGENGYAVGAFNVYNLEGIKAVIDAAESEKSPVILQVHPSALKFGKTPLIASCLEAARQARVSVAVHLDHSTSPKEIERALEAGVASVMADGSHLSFAENLAFTREMVKLADRYQAGVEAELGRLSGIEDDWSVPEYESRLTNPDQAEEFVQKTGVAWLAVCIGNVHGHYPGEPRLDFERLEAIRRRVDVPLVLHGTSGLPDEMIRRLIELGIRKFNVNSEVREAYLRSERAYFDESEEPDLLKLMQSSVKAMQDVVMSKLRVFGSSERTTDF